MPNDVEVSVKDIYHVSCIINVHELHVPLHVTSTVRVISKCTCNIECIIMCIII